MIRVPRRAAAGVLGVLAVMVAIGAGSADPEPATAQSSGTANLVARAVRRARQRRTHRVLRASSGTWNAPVSEYRRENLPAYDLRAGATIWRADEPEIGFLALDARAQRAIPAHAVVDLETAAARYEALATSNEATAPEPAAALETAAAFRSALGQTDEALADADRAGSLAGRVVDVSRLELAAANLAYRHRRPDALERYRRYVRRYADIGPLDQTLVAQLRIGIGHEERGDQRRAEANV